MNPEFYEYIIEKLFAAGALDVYMTPIQMKKNRPAVKLSVLIREMQLDEVINIILRESTSLGVRITGRIERFCLQREFKQIETPWGKVKIKIARNGDKVLNVSPEYDDCKKIAQREGIALKDVYRAAKNGDDA